MLLPFSYQPNPFVLVFSSDQCHNSTINFPLQKGYFMNNTTQINRITEMEQKLNKSSQVLQNLAAALEQYQLIRQDLEDLFAYYHSPLWLTDYDADNRGELSKDFPRGVLSEDAVYDLESEQGRLLAIMAQLLS